jgi:2-polyprenyl-3-methyl-5-hydroxy-6-metoxy-1,4-benzoquinol methylase
MTDKHYPQYDQLGELYDLAYGGDASGTDFYLYLSLAQETGSDVLEMGAGTGRICIALAALGIKVVGLELSREMIQLSHKKIAESLTEDQKKKHSYSTR